MGEILGPALLVLLVIIGGGVAVNMQRSSTRQRNALRRAPALLLPDGEPPDVLLANAQKNYILTQRAVRVLDQVLASPSAASLPKATTKEASAIVAEFYKH